MFIVKLTFNYDWPIFRQTPNNSGVWGEYKFIIDPQLKECDFWVIYTEHRLIEEKCICNPENIIFIPAEGYKTSQKYTVDFLNQFAKIITVQRQIVGKNIYYSQNANPWFIEKNFNELLTLGIPPKPQKISIISSDKDFTDGHIKRLKFFKLIKNHFGNKIDFFGRGIRGFEKKIDVTAPYKFQISIENDFLDDWVTEKFFDPILTYTMPVYYGCPNIEKYISKSSFLRINIENEHDSILNIEKILGHKGDEIYDEFLKNCYSDRMRYLLELQFFPFIVSYLKDLDHSRHLKKKVKIYGIHNINQGKLRYFMKSIFKKYYKQNIKI